MRDQCRGNVDRFNERVKNYSENPSMQEKDT